ncbi:hypothetical protein F5Y19DRAFT_469726 [Xylariaceae sp. FL1651]|nr:hypothetical protein F5Y19DRAFT_469726 [Xylariaceae sp. FL1651]
METINNMAATAAKVVWGENTPTTAEPVSGRTGDTSKGEPYDAGNIDDGTNHTNNTATTTATTADTTMDTTMDATSKTNTETDTAASGAANDHLNDGVKSAEFAKETGTAAESKDTPDNPSTSLKAKDAPLDTSKGQGDTRPPEDPKTNPKSAPTDVNDTAEEGINEDQKLDGPGPKPLQEVAKEHGGDAGNGSTPSVDTRNKEDKKDEEKEEKNEGTGEQYVKSSGLQADGGDFDATKPGAGKEADRLMEEKGMHKPTDPNSKGNDTATSSSPTSEKKSITQKIKDKLHRH